MSTKKKLLISVICLLVVAAAGLGLFALLRMNRDPASVYAVSEIAEFNGYFDGSTISGNVTTDRLQTVYLSQTQEVTQIRVSEGEEVRKGDPLMDFNTTLTELELQRKQISIQKLEQDLEKAQKEYKSLFGTAYQPTAAAQDTGAVLTLLGDAAASTQLTGPVLHLLGEQTLPGQEGEEKEDPTEPSDDPTEPSDDPTEPSEDPTEPSDEPTEPSEDPTEPSEDPTEPSDEPTEPSEEPTEPSEETEPTEEPDPDLVETYACVGGSGSESDPYLYIVADGLPLEDSFIQGLLAQSDPAHVVFATTEEDRKDGIVTSAWGLTFSRSENGWSFSFDDANRYVGSVLAPKSDPVDPDVPVEPDDPGPFNPGGGYSYEELMRKKAELIESMRDLDLKIRMGRVEYEKMQREMGDGTIYADFDGVVLSVGDPDTAYENNEPVLKVSGGGGYRIRAAVSELDLDKIRIGQTVKVVNYWDGYGEYEGTVEEISAYPTDAQYYYGDIQNVSYYPLTITVSAEADLQDGYYVDVNMNDPQEESNTFYLMKAFILQENGKSFVYVRGENDRLEKREIVTGRDMWGYELEILSGLTMDDWIAFPYGKTVTDGAKTAEAKSSDLWAY